MRKPETLKNLNSITDESLWMKFKEGDEDALSHIFLTYYNDLFSYTSRLLSNHEEAKDIIQDLFFKIWKNRTTLGKCNNIKFYLLQSLRRLVIDQYFKKETPFKTEITEQLLPSELSFESVLIDNEILSEKKKELKKAFTKLTKRQQEAVYLRYYQQADYPEIGQIMSLNVQSVRNLIYSALQILKSELGSSTWLFFLFLKKLSG